MATNFQTAAAARSIMEQVTEASTYAMPTNFQETAARARRANAEKSMAAFMAQVESIRQSAERLLELAEDHLGFDCGADGDLIDWGHVGSATELARQLREALAFIEPMAPAD